MNVTDRQLVVLGAELRSARKERGLTQPDVAAALGIANSVVHYYETGQIEPPTLRLFELAGLLRLRLDQLAVRVAGAKNKRRRAAAAA